MLTQKITIELEGRTDSDLVAAFDEAVSKVRQGFQQGGDRNESGRYYFDVDTSGVSEDEDEELGPTYGNDKV